MEKLEYVKNNILKSLHFSMYTQTSSLTDSVTTNENIHKEIEKFRENTYSNRKNIEFCTSYEEILTQLKECDKSCVELITTISSLGDEKAQLFYNVYDYYRNSLYEPGDKIKRFQSEYETIILKNLKPKVSVMEDFELELIDERAKDLCEKYGLRQFTYDTKNHAAFQIRLFIQQMDKTLANVCYHLKINECDLGLNSNIALKMDLNIKGGGYHSLIQEVILDGTQTNFVLHEFTHALDSILYAKVTGNRHAHISEPDLKDTIDEKSLYFDAYCEFKNLCHTALSTPVVKNKKVLEQYQKKSIHALLHHVIGLDYYALSPESNNKLKAIYPDLISFMENRFIKPDNEQVKYLENKIISKIESLVPNTTLNMIEKLQQIKSLDKLESYYKMSKDPLAYKFNSIYTKAMVMKLAQSPLTLWTKTVHLINKLKKTPTTLVNTTNFNYYTSATEMLARTMEASYYPEKVAIHAHITLNLIYAKVKNIPEIKESYLKVFSRIEEIRKSKIDIILKI